MHGERLRVLSPRIRPSGVILLLVLLLLTAAAVQAQALRVTAEPTVTPTAMILGAVNVPGPTPVPDDPRPAICSAPYLSGFAPVIVRPGDRLVDLMAGVTTLSITQIAALNCIDDPDALPVGAAIWLPLPPTPPPTVTPSITATSAPAAATAVITRLRASQTSLSDGETFTVTWSAQGSAAYFYACPGDSEEACPRPLNAEPLPLAHTTAPLGGFLYAGTYRYRLEVIAASRSATRDLTVTVTCAQPTLGSYSGRTPCPDEPIQTVNAVWQSFEGGHMVWFADPPQIWVLTFDGGVQVFEDTYEEGSPDPNATPPSGRRVPVRGFGLIWTQLGGPQSALGWAIDSESGADTLIQPAGRVSYTRFVQRMGGPVFAITLLPDRDTGWWAVLDSNGLS